MLASVDQSRRVLTKVDENRRGSGRVGEIDESRRGCRGCRRVGEC